jgi:heme-degrading monooxygenase HmoA
VNVEGTNGDQVNRRNEGEARKARRALLSTLQQMSAVDAPGFIAAEHYRNVEDEDTVIGIYDWKSNEERVAWSQSLDPGTREQLLEVLATPMRIVLADHIE